VTRTRGVRRVAEIMGTAISLDLADDLSTVELDRLVAETFDWLREVDRLFSTYKVDSEVSRLGRGELDASGCSTVVQEVLDRCADLWRETDGYFDAYATGTLDPSGYVKGWSVQVASDRLVAAGAPNHCLYAGGDIRVRGESSNDRPWRVGIKHPFKPMSVAWVLASTDLAVATSGIYERGTHVVDPRRGEPATELQSVTVVGADLGTADAYATAALAMGRAALDWLPQLDGYESAVVTAAGEAFTTSGLPLAPEA
jgi:FAD:protein FMN transferase